MEVRLRGEKGLGLEGEPEDGLLAFVLLRGTNGFAHFARCLAADGFEDGFADGHVSREGDRHFRPSNRLQRNPVAAHELEGQKEG